MLSTCPCVGCPGCVHFRSTWNLYYAPGDGNGGQRPCGAETSKANRKTCHQECHWCTESAAAALVAMNVLPLAIIDAVPAVPEVLAAPAKLPEPVELPAAPAAPAAPLAEPPVAAVDNMGISLNARMMALEQSVASLEKKLNAAIPAFVHQ